MDDTISRQAAIDLLCRALHYNYSEDYAVTQALELPSAQPERKKGHIIIRSNMIDGEECYCSVCDHWGLLPDYDFCPYCGSQLVDVIDGAEMTGGAE